MDCRDSISLQCLRFEIADVPIPHLSISFRSHHHCSPSAFPPPLLLPCLCVENRTLRNSHCHAETWPNTPTSFRSSIYQCSKRNRCAVSASYSSYRSLPVAGGDGLMERVHDHFSSTFIWDRDAGVDISACFHSYCLYIISMFIISLRLCFGRDINHPNSLPFQYPEQHSSKSTASFLSHASLATQPHRKTPHHCSHLPCRRYLFRAFVRLRSFR